MKNSHVAFWIAVLGGLLFLYNIDQIRDVERDADVWNEKVNANSSVNASSFVKSMFDGFTLGAFSNGDIFAEAHRVEQIDQQLEEQRIVLLHRYQDAVSYRNWGFVMAVGGVVAGRILKKKEFLLKAMA